MKIDSTKFIRLMVINALLLALMAVIAINLLVTGGKPAAVQKASPAPETAQAASDSPKDTPAPESDAAAFAAADSPVPSPEVSAPVAEAQTGTQAFSMRFVGDLMCCDGQMEDALQPDGSYDFLKHFAQIRSELTGADLLLGNFEACLYDSAPLNGSIVGFNAPMDYPKTLKELGFDVLFTANNHAMDFLVEGALETRQKLEDLGFAVLGTNRTKEEAGAVYLREINGVPVAILAYTGFTNKFKLSYNGEDASWAMNYYSGERLAADVETAKNLGAKIIVMYLHDGVEKDTEPSRRQTTAANEAAALGVDAIVMSHTHSLQHMERRTVSVDGAEKTVFIAYGLGNFMSSAIHTESLNNIILNLEFIYDWDKDALASLDASYLLTYTYNYYTDQKIMTYSIVPLRQALADFSIVDPRTRYSIERFQAAYDKMLKRIGTDAAQDVLSFHPAAATPAP